MAKIANENSDRIYITDDNPRNESPKKIRDELLKHIPRNKSFNIGKRKLAIKKAVENAEPQEVILIAGKGHEEHQIYKNKIINISDKKIIKKLNIKSNKFSKKRQNFLQNETILKKILNRKKSIKFDGLSIDTRTIKKNNLFLTLRGKYNDGSKFIQDALKKGAGCVLTSLPINKKNKKIIKIKNSISFLNKFASFKREHSLAKIIAVTGSAGKTSLKTLINDLLQNFGNTYSSPKSFNNHLGVPVSLSNLSPDNKFGIFEVGMSKAGEIKKLTKLIKPHIGVITNIGEAHIENFKNIHGIAKAKSEIIEGIKTGGTVILNRDDKFFNYLFKKAQANKLKVSSFGFNKSSDICVKKIIKKNNIFKVFINIYNLPINLEIKNLNIYNVLSSLAVLAELKVDVLKIKNKFKNFRISRRKRKKILYFAL